MAIGTITSNSIYSSLKYTGTTITNKFSTTSVNQELVLFEDKDGKVLNCNSVTISAGASDLYFTVLRDRNIDLDNHNFTDEPVLFVEANTSLTISGVSISGIKFANDSGVEYFITGTSY